MIPTHPQDRTTVTSLGLGSCCPMRVAVVFDTPYSGWDHPDHEIQMEKEVAAWKTDEPEMEYQIAHASASAGTRSSLIGVRDDLQYLVRCLAEWKPDLVFNGAEAFKGNEALEYLLPGLLEAEGYRYTGAPPLALQMTRNKAISKKVLAYFGIQVPDFVTLPPAGEGRRRARSELSAHREAAPGRWLGRHRPGFRGAGRRLPRRPGRLHSGSVRPGSDRRGVRRGPGALRERDRQRRCARDPADHRDGVRQAEDPTGGAHRHPVRQVGRGLPGAEGDPERPGPSNLPRRSAPGSRRPAEPPTGRSGFATTPGSTSGLRPMARSGSSKPTPIPSSATDTTWPTRPPRRGWNTTISSNASSMRRLPGMSARRRRRPAAWAREQRCVCGNQVQRYRAFCSACGRAQRWRRYRRSHRRRVLQVRVGGVG